MRSSQPGNHRNGDPGQKLGTTLEDVLGESPYHPNAGTDGDAHGPHPSTIAKKRKLCNIILPTNRIHAGIIRFGELFEPTWHDDRAVFKDNFR